MTFYTYCHTRNDTNKVFYIGKGKDNRAFHTHQRNKYWHHIVDKYGFKSKILAYWNSEKEAFNHEKLLISCFKDMGYKLVNMSDGGEGQSGFIHTQESKLKIKAKLTGKPKTEQHKLNVIEARKNYKPTEATKEKLRNLRVGTKLTQEHKEKIAKSRIGKKHSKETVEKMSNKAKNMTQEHKNKLSEAAKNRIYPK